MRVLINQRPSVVTVRCVFMQTKANIFASLTTCRKKFKSSLSDADGVVGFVRAVVGFARRVVVGTFCNKSSISLILIGSSVVLVAIFALSLGGKRVVGFVIRLK